LLVRNTIMPVEIYGKTVKAIYLGDYYGHSNIVIEGVPSEDIIMEIEDAAEKTKDDPVFKNPCIEIEGLGQGTYTIYTTTADKKDRSAGYTFTITEDTKAQNVQQAAEMSGVADGIYLQETVEDMSNKTNVVLWLWKRYNEAKNSYDKDAVATTLFTYIELLNKRMQKCGFTSEPFVIGMFNGQLKMDGEANRIIRHNLLNKKTEMFTPKPLQRVFTAPEEDGGLYLYLEVNEDGMPINLALSFKPDTKTMDSIKNNLIQRNEKLQRALERTIDYPRSYLEFSEDELQWVSIIDKLRDGIPVFRAPDLQYEHGIITITPHEEDIGLLDFVSGNLYLAINELEYCLESNRRRISMQPNEFYIYNDSFGIGTEPYLYWIENEDGKVLSDIRVLNLSVDSEMGGVVYDTDDANYINERLRKLELYHYKKHLIPMAQNNTTTQSNFEKITDAFSVCESDGETQPAGITDSILDRNLLRSNILDFAEVSRAVMRDKITYSRYGTNIIKDPFYYRSKLNTIVLPMGQDVLYKIVSYDFENGRQVKYIPAQNQSTQEYRFNNVEWAYITAFDAKDMRTSGYIMLDFSKRGVSANVYTYMAVNVEVGY